MSRLGESELSIHSVTVGSIWVTGIHAEPSFEPRLAFRIGLQLGERPAPQHGFPPVRSYRVSDLGFQLRWRNETGPIVGDLTQSGGGRDMRSAEHGAKFQLTASLGLLPRVIEALESNRNGKPPVFCLCPWLSVISEGVVLHVTTRPLTVTVPRDDWVAFLSESRFAEIDVLEIRSAGLDSEEMSRAAEHLRSARASLDRGDLNASVGTCRLAMEAAAKAIGGDTKAALQSLLVSKAGERVGGEYQRIASALRQLSAETFHDYGADTKYGRAEALFAIRCTEALLSLVGSLEATSD